MYTWQKLWRMIHTVQDTSCDTQTEPENAIDDRTETNTPVARLISLPYAYARVGGFYPEKLFVNLITNDQPLETCSSSHDAPPVIVGGGSDLEIQTATNTKKINTVLYFSANGFKYSDFFCWVIQSSTRRLFRDAE